MWPSNTIWCYKTWSALAQVRACCLMAPSPYLNQCWILISEVHHRRAILQGIPQPSITKSSLKNMHQICYWNLLGVRELTWCRGARVNPLPTPAPSYLTSPSDLHPGQMDKHWNLAWSATLQVSLGLNELPWSLLMRQIAHFKLSLNYPFHEELWTNHVRMEAWFGQNVSVCDRNLPMIGCCYNTVNTLRPRQNGCHFADAIFKCIFLKENVWIPIKISLKFVPKSPINNIPALV